jgi:hypothetical protein
VQHPAPIVKLLVVLVPIVSNVLQATMVVWLQKPLAITKLLLVPPVLYSRALAAQLLATVLSALMLAKAAA